MPAAAESAFRASSEELPDRRRTQLILRQEALGARSLQGRAELVYASAGAEQDLRRISIGRQLGRQRDPIAVGKLDVEQHGVRQQLAERPARRVDTGGLADDLEATRLQQPTRAGPEARVVIDDQDSPAHGADCRAWRDAFPYG